MRPLSSLIVLLLLALTAGPGPRVSAATTVPAHHLQRGFQNVDTASRIPLLERAWHVLHRGVALHLDRGAPLHLVANDGTALRENHGAPTLTWIGHATFLVQIDGINVLTDPIWGGTVGPLSMIGLRRLILPGVRFEDLPPIDAVVISHDHYDHLDVATVRRLHRAHHPRFFVPLGLKPWFAGLGITDVVELDWWQTARLQSVTFASVPAQHASGRSLTDQNLRLWSSWVITGRTKRFFFGGDTGYHAGFAGIAGRFGRFDAAALPIGGYSAFERHHPNHLNPEEAVRAFEDLHAGRLVPMHWGTFELNREPAGEPPARLWREAVRRGDQEHVSILSPGQTIPW
ncbi:MAG: metallohydrolase [Candidatus Rokuibacteriota bacterium]|nr:MAG: metallohydrolase [Candidatus Rokubacteria bacterium]